MKRGLILFFVIISLFIVNAQNFNEDLRVNIDTRRLGNEGIIINLTEFLGQTFEYFLISEPKFVKVNIDNDFGLAKITKLGTKEGTDILIFTINRTRKLSPQEKVLIEDINEQILNSLSYSLNSTLDKSLDRAITDYIKNLNFENYTIDSTNADISNGLLLISIDNISSLNLNLEKKGDGVLLRNVGFNFTTTSNDDKYLYYSSKSDTYVFLRKNILLISIFLFLAAFVVLIILLFKNKNDFRKTNKEYFKKIYLNKLNLLRRRSYHESNYNDIFEQFSDDMRTFFSKILNIKYKYTYDELVNELIVKKVDRDFRKDVTAFAKEMTVDTYKKKPNLAALRELIEKGINIIRRF